MSIYSVAYIFRFIIKNREKPPSLLRMLKQFEYEASDIRRSKGLLVPVVKAMEFLIILE